MKRLFRKIIITTLLIMAYNYPLPAVDEDYFIPYTDNYGYEYDPETGTYIKKEQTTTSPENQQQSTAHETATAVAQQMNTPAIQPDVTTERSDLGLPLLVAGVLIIAGGLMIFSRRSSNNKGSSIE